MHCLYGGYNLHRFSDALGLVYFITSKSKNSLWHAIHIFAAELMHAVSEILFWSIYKKYVVLYK